MTSMQPTCWKCKGTKLKPKRDPVRCSKIDDGEFLRAISSKKKAINHSNTRI